MSAFQFNALGLNYSNRNKSVISKPKALGFKDLQYRLSGQLPV